MCYYRVLPTGFDSGLLGAFQQTLFTRVSTIQHKIDVAQKNKSFFDVVMKDIESFLLMYIRRNITSTPTLQLQTM